MAFRLLATLVFWHALLHVEGARENMVAGNMHREDIVPHMAAAGAARRNRERRARQQAQAQRERKQRAEAARQREAAARKEREAEALKRQQCLEGAVEVAPCDRPCSGGHITMVNEAAREACDKYNPFYIPCNTQLCHEDRWKQQTITERGLLRGISYTIADQDGPLRNEGCSDSETCEPTVSFHVYKAAHHQEVASFHGEGAGAGFHDIDLSTIFIDPLYVAPGYVIKWKGAELEMPDADQDLIAKLLAPMQEDTVNVDRVGFELSLDIQASEPSMIPHMKLINQLPHVVTYMFTSPHDNGADITGYVAEVNCAGSKREMVLDPKPETDGKHYLDMREVTPNTQCTVSLAAENSEGRGEAKIENFVVPSKGCSSKESKFGGEKCCKGPHTDEYACVKKSVFGSTCTAVDGWSTADNPELCGHSAQ